MPCPRAIPAFCSGDLRRGDRGSGKTWAGCQRTQYFGLAAFPRGLLYSSAGLEVWAGAGGTGCFWQAGESLWPSGCWLASFQLPAQPVCSLRQTHNPRGGRQRLCRQGFLGLQVLGVEIRTSFGCTEVRVDNDLSLHLIPARRGWLLSPVALAEWRTIG